MLLDTEARFEAVLGEIGPESQTWNILDHDTRAWTAVEGPSTRFGADHEGGIDTGKANAINEFRKIVDDMFEPVNKVVFGESGDFISTSSLLQDDCTPNIYYPQWKLHVVGPDNFRRTFIRSELTEVNRISSSVDQVEYTRPDRSKSQQVVKYHLVPGEKEVEKFWREAFLNLALVGRNYAPIFGRFVVEDIRNVMVGFTTRTIHGHSLRLDRDKFRRTFLEQLLDAVDDLNLNLGIIHQDITTSNVIVDHHHRRLTIIGYGEAAREGSRAQVEEKSDIKGVVFLLYDVLTQTDCRIPLVQRDYNALLAIRGWPVKCALERGLTFDHICDVVIDWISNRSGNKFRSGEAAPCRVRSVHIPKMSYLNGLLPEYCDPSVHLDFYYLPQPARPPFQRDLPSDAYLIKWGRHSVHRQRRESLMTAKKRVTAPEKGMNEETSGSVHPSPPPGGLPDLSQHPESGRHSGRRSRRHRNPHPAPDPMEIVPEE